MSHDIVILAAGQGTRMRSALPKVLHPVAGKAMLGHVIDTARKLEPKGIHVVIGHGAETVRERLFVYYRDTSPLIGYYYAKGILHTVDGMGPIDEVTAAVARVIDALR